MVPFTLYTRLRYCHLGMGKRRIPPAQPDAPTHHTGLCHVTKCLQSNYQLPRTREGRARDIYSEREDLSVPPAWPRHCVTAGSKQSAFSANKCCGPGQPEPGSLLRVAVREDDSRERPMSGGIINNAASPGR